jgi:hypothetical protein
VAGGDNNSFAEAVDNNKHGISVSRFREIGDKIHGNGLPDVSRDQIWLHGDLGVWFIFSGLTDSAAVYIVFGKLEKARPPVFSEDEFIGLPSSRVAYGRVIVVHF